MRARGQRVIITGGADGLGLAMAKKFAREGARLFILDVHAGKTEAAARSLRAEGVEVETFVGSTAEAAAVEAAFAQADAALGGVDALINNAGVTAPMPTVDLDDATWERVIGVNLNGCFLCARAAGKRMLRQGSGSIVNVSSIYGIVPAPNRLAYCVSKSAVAMMARALAIEWADRGVRVNAIAPGYVHTSLIDGLINNDTIDIEAIRERTPMKRLGKSEEIADMAVHLCSPAAAYITGQVIAVDGGWTAYGYIQSNSDK